MIAPADLPNPLPIPRLVGPLHGTARVPGSKSITNRALVCSALAGGTTTILGALDAEDIDAMINGLRLLGATIERDDNVLTVDGVAGQISDGPLVIDANQSGTTSRFLAAVLAIGSGQYVLDGHEQMRARPLGDLVTALDSLGVTVNATRGEFLPITVHAEGMTQGMVELGANVSSQFASGLLLAAPCFPDGLDLSLVGPIVSQPYLDMTVSVMRSFGADLTIDPDGRRYLVAPTGYRACEYTVEPDASTASYFFALGALGGGAVEVVGLTTDSIQGDAGFAAVLAQMGASVEPTTSGLRLSSAELSGGAFDLTHMSDLAPTLGVVAACAKGPTTVTGIGFIRRKESDRIDAMVTQLGRLGVGATEADDGFTIAGAGTENAETKAVVVDTYQDHRNAMAFTVLGLVRGGVSIADPECVAKTFPGFFDEIFRLASGAGMHSEPTARSSSASGSVSVIAIDGPSGSGKSTVAKALATHLDVGYLDTGAMYRAVAFAVLQRKVDPGDEAAVTAIARSVEFEVTVASVVVDGVDATSAIRGAEVTTAVSAVAANPNVRLELQKRQREWAIINEGGVIEGRDIGTVVFPDARLKVFLTADAATRAMRRAREVADQDYDTVAADLTRRDQFDSTRKHNPLAIADDAIELDTSALSIEEVVAHIIDLIPGEK